jgi:hypothetical protein
MLNRLGPEALFWLDEYEDIDDWHQSVVDFPFPWNLVLFCSIGDTRFKMVVDTILSGNVKTILRSLSVPGGKISSHGLAVDATRLVEHCSQLNRLRLPFNHGMLDVQEHVQTLCDKLKKNKSLLSLDLSFCSTNKRTLHDTTTLLVDMLQVNTTLTELHVKQPCGRVPYVENRSDRINRRRLEPWLRRNKRLGTVLAGVQELLHHHHHHHPNNDNDDDGDENSRMISIAADRYSWRLILNAALEDVDRDRSALYLLMRTAIVSDGGPDDDDDDGASCPLHVQVVDWLKLSSLNNDNSDREGGGRWKQHRLIRSISNGWRRMKSCKKRAASISVNAT